VGDNVSMSTTIPEHGFGIGAQVYIESASDEDPSPWPAEPSGVITGAGGAAIQRVTNVGGPTRTWIVQFDEPQRHRDGTDGHTSAPVHEKFLHLAPPYEPALAEVPR
jgi:hypothetical protein